MQGLDDAYRHLQAATRAVSEVNVEDIPLDTRDYHLLKMKEALQTAEDEAFRLSNAAETGG